MHKLLLRQLRRCFGSPEGVPTTLTPLVQLVDQTYREVDEERRLFERSMIIASEELYQRNIKLQSEHHTLEQTLAELREQTRTTESLIRIARIISAELDPQVLAQRVIELATSAINADFGVLCCDVQRAQHDAERLHAAAGPLEQTCRGFCHTLAPMIKDLSIPQGSVIRVADTQAPQSDPFLLALCCAAKAAGIQSLLLAPLRSRNELAHGKILFARAAASPFTLRDEQLIEGIVSHAAIAIENARLFRSAQEANEQLAHQALYDTLTGLPSRRLFRQRLDTAFAGTQADHERSFAVVFIDLDRFKSVNDLHGHEAGDLLLRATADRLRTALRHPSVNFSVDQTATVARLGGDEFTIIVENVRGSDQVSKLGHQICLELCAPFILDGNELRISASVGIAFGNHQSLSVDDVLRNADAAMYHAKANGASRYSIYDAQIHDSIQRRQQVEDLLALALERREFFLQYQPITCLQSRKLIGFEALIRWRRGEALISPAEFIPIAEQSHVIVDIGMWVIDTACAQYAQWRKDLGGDPEVTLNINLSRRQLLDENLVGYVADRLRAHDVPPSRVNFEITESMVMEDMETSLQTLKALKSLGVGLQMDDFGIGHSSLAHLSTLPLDGLKIDRVFIRNVSYRRDCLAILQAIISLAHNLNITVVAEGIEEPEQVVLLQALDCDYAQGFLFARPLDPETALQFISATYLPLVMPMQVAA